MARSNLSLLRFQPFSVLGQHLLLTSYTEPLPMAFETASSEPSDVFSSVFLPSSPSLLLSVFCAAGRGSAGPGAGPPGISCLACLLVFLFFCVYPKSRLFSPPSLFSTQWSPLPCAGHWGAEGYKQQPLALPLSPPQSTWQNMAVCKSFCGCRPPQCSL